MKSPPLNWSKYASGNWPFSARPKGLCGFHQNNDTSLALSQNMATKTPTKRPAVKPHLADLSRL
jgi:hypothetical protein